jgi:hypothetical protein
MSIPRAHRGQPITADLINSIIDEINKNNLVSISGGKLNKSINGTTISVSPSAPPAIQADIPPFYYSSVATTGSGFYFRLTAGTINNYIPDNNFDTIMLSATTPSPNSLLYVTLDCDTDGHVLLSSVITARTTPPIASSEIASAPATFGALLYVIKSDANSSLTPYRVIGQGSPVARVTEVGRIGKNPIPVGELPYNIYYTWTIFT